MPERLQFVFDGQLAAAHRMEFYESARFQYAASRLLVKLDNFRRTGRFPKKISAGNDHDIQIVPYREGSFGIEILIPFVQAGGMAVFEVSISSLFAYVVDRVFKSAEEDNIRAALQTQQHLIESYDENIQGRDDTISQTIALLRDQMEHDRHLNIENRELFERLVTETERRAFLQGQRRAFRRMTPDQEADLITMSAPLLREMNVPLRRSADRVDITATIGERRHRILHADKQMAGEVDIAVIDRNITQIDINVIQFNKENGWGKFRNPEWEGLASFSVPSDMLDEVRADLVAAMNLAAVSVECYFVRSVAMVPLRIIVVGVYAVEE